MQIYIFRHKNYYSLNRTFRVLANSKKEAEDMLNSDDDIKHYLWDDETEFVGCEVVDIDKPKILP